jgi:hypothetical protein
MLNVYNANVTAKVAAQVIANYPASSFKGGWSRMASIITDFFFACSTRRAARALASHGTPVWLCTYCASCVHSVCTCCASRVYMLCIPCVRVVHPCVYVLCIPCASVVHPVC